MQKKLLSQRFIQSKQTFQQNIKYAKEHHENMIKMIKIILIVGMILMASLYRYRGFIKEHQTLFILEIITYCSCAIGAYLFMCFMRNQLKLTSVSFWQGLITTTIFTVIIVISAELSGMNTKFVQEGSEETMTPYRKEALRFKKQLWSHMIMTINLLFIVLLILWHSIKNDRLSFFLLVLGVAIAILSTYSLWINKQRTFLYTNQWLGQEGADTSVSELGLVMYFMILFGIFTFVVLFTSLFRYDSFKIYSYFPNNPNMCGMKRAGATMFLFLIEALLVSFMFAVPILYVGSNRNKPELGDAYKIIKDKEVFMDLGMLTLKIFIFMVALQMTGFFDTMNEGYQRKEGCNLKKIQR